MRTFLFIMAIVMACCSSMGESKAASADEAGKVLVVYYSYTGNSRQIVQSLTDQIDADVMEIEPAEKGLQYEANNYALGMQLLNAINAAPDAPDSYPAIDPVSITDLSGYDNIIIVTPLWWSQMAAIMQTYLFNYGPQMAGKHVGLIVSSHSSDIPQVVLDAKRLVPDAVWMGDALWIKASNHANRAALISNWIASLDFAQGQSSMDDKLYITIDGVTQSATLVDNAATRELMTRLRVAPITVTLNSSGGFEIWGALGFALPTSNEQVDAQPGDMVLYNGSNICLFYGSNSWSYTRLGHIDDLNTSELRTFLKAGESNIGVTLSLAPGSPVKPGDVNGDGEVNISDVTALIDLLLSGETGTEMADVNNDGEVNISDVTSIIDMLLGGDV
ncbi:MAG: hypothetical protein II040_02065 [Muribaculaceae bacterium]|jgi:flavodoxin|nr:hypothetical protein [Muribaculaceae bacterium]